MKRWKNTRTVPLHFEHSAAPLPLPALPPQNLSGIPGHSLQNAIIAGVPNSGPFLLCRHETALDYDTGVWMAFVWTGSERLLEGGGGGVRAQRRPTPTTIIPNP